MGAALIKLTTTRAFATLVLQANTVTSSSPTVQMIPVSMVYHVLKTATQLSLAVLVHLVLQATEKTAKTSMTVLIAHVKTVDRVKMVPTVTHVTASGAILAITVRLTSTTVLISLVPMVDRV